jgi:hypothetical protein
MTIIDHLLILKKMYSNLNMMKEIVFKTEITLVEKDQDPDPDQIHLLIHHIDPANWTPLIE